MDYKTACFLSLGSCGYLFAIVYLIRDCRRTGYSTMGGQMSFSAYWLLSSFFLTIGLILYFDIPWFWSILIIVGLYLFRFIFGHLIENLAFQAPN